MVLELIIRQTNLVIHAYDFTIMLHFNVQCGLCVIFLMFVFCAQKLKVLCVVESDIHISAAWGKVSPSPASTLQGVLSCYQVTTTTYCYNLPMLLLHYNCIHLCVITTVRCCCCLHLLSLI